MPLLIQLLHFPLLCAYLIAPLAALAIDIRRARHQGRLAPSPAYVGTVCAGIALGTGACVTYAMVAGGRADLSQVAMASFFAAGMLFLLKAFDWVLRRLLNQVVNRWLIIPATLLRAVVLFGIGLPYILAAGLTYRPKIISRADPLSTLGYQFESVAFNADDGVQLRGWWIPATGKPSTNTLVLCHGVGLGKSTLLPFTKQFVPQGYNVLLFDFRAHGQSGGQLTTFGDLERRDVLGAVRWLQENHQKEATRIDGVGIETGAAALVGAAADEGAAGHAIQTLVLYDGYDELSRVGKRLAMQRFVPPLNWLFANLGLPLMNWQTGAELTTFSPGDLMSRVWPRPVFVINAVDEQTFNFEASRRLFDDVSGPRQRRWVNNATISQLLTDPATTSAVLKFLHTAEPLPVI